jgi:pimeloyl-ACP methyl ester carboxylesterase
MLPRLEISHEVLAPTLPGHAGGPPLPDRITQSTLPAAVERAMDEAGFETAHIVGNSLGGFVALQLAARGRARSVTAFAPTGGWAAGDDGLVHTLRYFQKLHPLVKAAAPNAEAIMASTEGRRRATEFSTVSYEHIPAELLAHQLVGAALCEVEPLTAWALREGYVLEAERIECPVRIVWGLEDRILTWPKAAARFKDELPQAEWVELSHVGHCPQLDVPLESAQLVLGLTAS